MSLVWLHYQNTERIKTYSDDIRLRRGIFRLIRIIAFKGRKWPFCVLSLGSGQSIEVRELLIDMAKFHKALREREPERTLVIGSNMWQGVSTMKYLKVPKDDKHILLSCHFYEPMALTHYTAGWTEYGQYYGEINYPGVMISEEEFAKLDEPHQDIFRQFTTEWNRDRLAEMVGEAAKVAKKLGLPLYCGEWGVYFKAPREAAYSWYRDMISIFDQYDMAWSTWCYFDEFGFWSLERQTISDQPMLDILLSGKALGE